jgi:hypothetical protein
MLRMPLLIVLGLAVLAIPSARVVAQDAPARAGIAGAGFLLGIFESQDRTSLRRMRRPSLETEEASPRVAEYRWTAAVSPDGRRVAIGSGGPRGGITIFDVASLQQTQRVHAGIAPDALAWLSPTRVAAALTCNLANASGRGCEVVLVDADAGEIVSRWFLSFTPPLPPIPKPVAVTKHGVLFLLAHVSERAPARLVLITPDEQRRDLSLPEIELGVAPGGSIFDQTSGGLAVDSAGDTAFVVGAGRTLAEIELETMTVRYRDIQELEPGSPGSWRTIITLDGGRLAITGEGAGPPPRLPAGVTIVDTATWRGWRVDADASRAVFAGQTLLTYGGRSPGVTGHTSSGERRFQLFQASPERQSILSVRADGTHAFVTRRSADGRGVITEIDAVNGTVVRESITPGSIVDLLPFSN